MTLTEIMAIGRGSILVPYPNATENHQYYNAKTLKDANAAVLIEDKDLNGKWLVETVSGLVNDKARLELMDENAKRLSVTNAADIIAGHIIDLVKK